MTASKKLYHYRTTVWKFKVSEDLPPVLSKSATAISAPADVYRQFSPLFKDEVVEKFVVAYLTSRKSVDGYSVVTSGILNSSLVHPREVFADAIAAFRASSIIIMHNHPSGSPEPSGEDIRVTRQLVEAGRILGIPVDDHVIFHFTGAQGYTSFAERGLL